MHLQLTTNAIARFWARVAIGPPDACWPWRGQPETDGYARVRFNGRRYPVHRLAYILTHGQIDPHLHVCHACDNRPCCNPTHLWQGTTQANTADRVAKGRSAFGARNGSRTHPERVLRGDAHPSHIHQGAFLPHGDQHWTHRYPERVKRGADHPARQRPDYLRRGSQNNHARLREAGIPVIRARLAAGDSVSAIARDYGVTRCPIKNIKYGRGWTHVP